MILNLKVSRKKTNTSGERDVSARATHLKAAIGKVSMTTIERKRMSTKTTIKRIALVAAASLGLGVLSVVPANAASTQISITSTAGSKTLGSLVQDTATGALVTVTANHSAASDSTIVTIMPKTYPTGASATSILGNLVFVDTAVSGLTLSTNDTVMVVTNASAPISAAIGAANGLSTGATLRAAAAGSADLNVYSARSLSKSATVLTADSVTTTATGGGSVNAFQLRSESGSTGYVGARFRLYLDTYTAVAAGTYTFTITATPYTGATAGTPVTADVSVVVAATATDASQSVAYIGAGTTAATFNSDTLTVVATASNTTAVANYTVTLKDANGLTTGVAESVTATTTVGNVGDAATNPTILGQNVQLKYTSGSSLTVGIFGAGSSGTATVCVKTATVTFPCKTVIFYSTTAATLTAAQVSSTLAVGSNSTAIIANAKDANGNWIPTSTSVYVFSDNTAVVAETASTCSVDTTNNRMNCTLTGVAAGTANIMLGTNTAKANATAAFKVTVTNNAIASIAITSNKTSYLPGEVAYIRVTAKDSAGNSVAPQTIGNFFATGGITTNVGLGANSATISGTSVTLSAQTTTGYATGDAVAQFTVYMPAGGASMTFSATGGSGLPAALQGVAITPYTVTISDSGSQALAAVTALASQVSAFITKINAQITTLTDLVMKIQKKVKA